MEPVTYDSAEFDENGDWTGTCEACSTSHDGYPPDTVGGAIRCVRAQAEVLGASHLVDQADAGLRDIRERRDAILRDEGIIP